MQRWIALLVIAVFTLVMVSPVHAQQPAEPGDQHHQPPAAGAPAPRPGGPPQGGPGGGMMGGMMPMEMCHQMMSSHMDGMMGGQQPMDPKMMAEMMEMRGEIMKAVGDIMIKHAKKMHGMTSK